MKTKFRQKHEFYNNDEKLIFNRNFKNSQNYIISSWWKRYVLYAYYNNFFAYDILKIFIFSFLWLYFLIFLDTFVFSKISYLTFLTKYFNVLPFFVIFIVLLIYLFYLQNRIKDLKKKFYVYRKKIKIKWRITKNSMNKPIVYNDKNYITDNFIILQK
jgi:hypothetical protein